MNRHRLPLGPIHTGAPVVREHPLNQGLISWWMVLPSSGWRGSLTWRDLCRRNHGTLTNGPTWQGGRRPGGWGSLRFDRAALEYVVGSQTYSLGTGDFAILLWANVASRPDFGYLAGLDEASAGTGIMLFSHRDSGEFRVWVANQVSNTNAGPFTSPGWHQVGVSRRSGTVSLYVDGVLDSTFASAGSVLSSQRFLMGAYIGGGGGYKLDGSLDDVRFYNRALSDSEVSQLYQLSRRGYPGVLRRWSPSTCTVGASTAPLALYHRRRRA